MSLPPFARKRLKQLEQQWRAWLIRSVARLSGPTERLPAPDWGARPYRVLYLRHDRIGDMILATSLIRAVAESHPTIALDVLASPANAPVLRHAAHVGEVLVFDRGRPRTWPRFFRRLRRRRYDAVLDCMVLSPSTTTMLLMLATGAPYRIGIGGRSNDFIYTLPVEPTRAPEAHHIEHSAALAAAFGVDVAARDWRPVITLTDEERAWGEERWRDVETRRGASAPRGTRLLVNLSAGKAKRYWPDERFVAVLRHARARRPDLDIAVFGLPSERERVERIAADGGGTVVRTPRLRDAFALVAAADLLFTPDTSIAHAASAFGKPAVVLYVRGMDVLYAPYHTGGRALASPDRTLEALPAAPALAALDDLLDGFAPAPKR